MRRHWAYAKYVFRHKWFVFVECCRLGIPWLGITHDWSKLRPSEWFPYARYFYTADGQPRQRRDKTGYYRPSDTGDSGFDQAIFRHVGRRNKHHWQAWILPGDDGGEDRVFPMPDRYRREMLADWRGASRAQGLTSDDVRGWYRKNSRKLRLHPETRRWVSAMVLGRA